MDRLDLMSTFVRIVETGSLSAVARELKTTQPTVSKRLDALERHLGVRLLERNTRGVRCTEAGERYYESGRALIDSFDQLEASVATVPRGVQGRLRLNSPVAFGEHVLTQLACDFRAINPQLQIHCTLIDRVVDLVEDGVDVAVRMGKKVSDPTVVARPLGALGYALVATPAYLKKNRAPRTPEELSQHPYLRYEVPAGPEQLVTPGGTQLLAVKEWVELNNTTAVKNAVLRGHAIGRLPRYLVQAELTEGRLREVLPGIAPAPLPLFALYIQSRFVPEKVRTFIDFLAAEVKRLPGWEPFPSGGSRAIDAPSS